MGLRVSGSPDPAPGKPKRTWEPLVCMKESLVQHLGHTGVRCPVPWRPEGVRAMCVCQTRGQEL